MHVSVSAPSPSSSFLSFLSRRSSGVNMRARLRSSWAACRSAICLLASCSSAVGSATACSASTRYRLLILILGLGGSSRPCLISSCFSFSRACLLCVRSFLISFLVSLRGWGGGGGASAGGSMGTGCSTYSVILFCLMLGGSSPSSGTSASYDPPGSRARSHHSTSGTGSAGSADSARERGEAASTSSEAGPSEAARRTPMGTWLGSRDAAAPPRGTRFGLASGPMGPLGSAARLTAWSPYLARRRIISACF
mmetsp:Transcript_8390/g.17945  ORF Transcript_8390/g.17945 Transcript_8390/m.17945 type:complete len:252 (-) Transcript_8390:905-1660(-)